MGVTETGGSAPGTLGSMNSIKESRHNKASAKQRESTGGCQVLDSIDKTLNALAHASVQMHK